LRTRANKQSGATIKDVAERAGVSAMTVSRVLNGESRVRDETRERVLDAMKALDYRPNISARSLAKARSFFLGLLYNNPNPGYVSELLIGMMNRCRQAGYHLAIEDSGSTDSHWAKTIDAVLRTSNFDGVILPPPVSDFRSVRTALEEMQIPYIRIAPEHDRDAVPSVITDDREAAQRMTKYLLELGHTRIGFIQGDPEHGSSRQREAGYRAALEQANVEIRENWVQPGRYTYRSGLVAAESLLSADDRPTAIFASNDDMAAAVVAVANRLGLDVPGDLSIAGFDDTQTATTLWPQLTTVRQPIAEMAAASIDMLTRMLEKGDETAEPDTRLIPCELIVRGSTAPPVK